jgi:hypothetical protein
MTNVVWSSISQERAMTHRAALVASIALTLVLALGIFAGRDRLFEAAVNAGPATATSAVSPDDAVRGSEQPVAGTAPRVIEIPLPTEQRITFQGDDDSQQARGVDGGHERDQDDDEHEEEDDD